MSEFEEVKLEKLRNGANLREVEFPACCLSCVERVDVEGGDNYCSHLRIMLNNVFSICNFHVE